MVVFKELAVMQVNNKKDIIISRCENTGKIAIAQRCNFTNADGTVAHVFEKNAIHLDDEQFKQFVEQLGNIVQNI